MSIASRMGSTSASLRGRSARGGPCPRFCPARKHLGKAARIELLTRLREMLHWKPLHDFVDAAVQSIVERAWREQTHAGQEAAHCAGQEPRASDHDGHAGQAIGVLFH